MVGGTHLSMREREHSLGLCNYSPIWVVGSKL